MLNRLFHHGPLWPLHVSHLYVDVNNTQIKKITIVPQNQSRRPQRVRHADVRRGWARTRDLGVNTRESSFETNEGDCAYPRRIARDGATISSQWTQKLLDMSFHFLLYGATN